ncbi:MAG TPA: hypothetical protein PLC80_03630 [Draconibacterium sp.]|nr:hypothetical protein [Draconibacterium sp.]
MEAENVKWQWDETKLDNTAIYCGSQLNYVFDEVVNTGRLQLSDVSGNVNIIWEGKNVYADTAFLLIDENVLFAAVYSQSSTGCKILALNLSSNQILWENQLLGLGSVGHSRYRNKVQMILTDNKLVVFGQELGGKYIEVRNPASGDLILNRKI